MNTLTTSGWHFWIDRGGTFTDIVARRPDGLVLTHKLLSENPGRHGNSALHGIREILGIEADQAIPAAVIASVKMGTTVATNALLERKGEATLLVTTRGFGDALRIGYQNRPRLFDLHIRLPELLYSRVIELDERITAQGTVLRPLDLPRARLLLRQAYDEGLRSVAIVLMHGYRHPDHERRLGDLARDIGYTQISLSHEVSPLMKLISRGDTTVVDAYLSPVLRRYVDGFRAELPGVPLLFMQSGGGLTGASQFRGKDSILSGPAGGVVAGVRIAAAAGYDKVIGFDMGGTSTDVWHHAGEFERSFQTTVAGVRLAVPMLQIHTIAAGGGSILHFDGARLRVGPESAGAHPGPACYRRGGPLTVTDCNVVLGRLRPERFPRVFGPGGDQPIDAEASRRAFAELTERVNGADKGRRSIEDVANGFLRIAIENMANAIRKVSVQRGYDVRQYLLAGFGSAGGQHVCAVADALGMGQILLHPHAGLLSAYGMGLADLVRIRQTTVEQPLSNRLLEDLPSVIERLTADGRTELHDLGVAASAVRTLTRLRLRYQGSDHALPVTHGNLAAMTAKFEDLHRQQFGFADAGRTLIVETVVVEVTGASDTPMETPARPSPDRRVPTPDDEADVFMDGRRRRVPLFTRERLSIGHTVNGPALLVEPHSTVVLETGWQAEITPRNHLLLTRHQAWAAQRQLCSTSVDPVMLEIFNNAFMAIAEQMGAVLEKTAHSVNIKERLDFSCAIFDRHGHLIANAPHMPVHLGSMGESVRAVMAACDEPIRPGDAYALNSPYHGGTHLPDITVVSAVHDPHDHTLLYWVAARGHHADIGGISPGSMPSDSTRVDEEGILLEPMLVLSHGRFDDEAIRLRLAAGPYPARNPEQNLADLKAQLAACATGAQGLLKLSRHYGTAVVAAYMSHVQDYAAQCVGRLIGKLNSGTYRCAMDNGCEIRVRVDIDQRARTAVVDFAGTSPQQSNNFNAPPAVVRAAVLYVFRTLIDEDIPLNDGFLRPITLILPEGSMLRPSHPAATVAGNVETSQIITDCLYAALGKLAASQGTMNNLTFGNARYQYYETIAGGSGAGPDFDGTSAVQTHMTNSRLTDPEVLEWRFPVLLEEFRIRQGSGGQGRHRGGDGVIRSLRALEPMTASILSNRRSTSPHGLDGGDAGLPGSNHVLLASGESRTLGATARVELHAGDVLTIKTPGGGGYGS